MEIDTSIAFLSQPPAAARLLAAALGAGWARSALSRSWKVWGGNPGERPRCPLFSAHTAEAGGRFLFVTERSNKRGKGVLRELLGETASQPRRHAALTSSLQNTAMPKPNGVPKVCLMPIAQADKARQIRGFARSPNQSPRLGAQPGSSRELTLTPQGWGAPPRGCFTLLSDPASVLVPG